MFYAVEGYTNRCTNKPAEHVNFESKSWCYGIDTSDIPLPPSATTMMKAGLGMECPDGRQVNARMHDAICILAATTTALSADAGNEPQWGELHDDVLRTLRGSRWTVLIYYDPLHAEDHLAMGMGQSVHDDLVKNRITGRMKFALHLRIRRRAGDQLARMHPRMSDDLDFNEESGTEDMSDCIVDDATVLPLIIQLLDSTKARQRNQAIIWIPLVWRRIDKLLISRQNEIGHTTPRLVLRDTRPAVVSKQKIAMCAN